MRDFMTLVIQRRDLEADRTRIERVQHHQVADRGQRHADQVAGAIGDLAVDQVEQQVEVVQGGVVIGQAAHHAAGVHAALDAAAHIQKAPAGDPVHVFRCQARQGG